MMKSIPLPSDESIEFKILGFALDNVDAATEILFTLKDDDFFYPKNLVCFNVLKDVFNTFKILEMPTIFSFLKKDDSIFKSSGGIDYFMSARDAVAFTGEDYNIYISQLKNLTALRKLVRSSRETINDACKPLACHEEIRQKIFKTIYEIEGISNSKNITPQKLLDEFSNIGNFEENLDWMRQRKLDGLSPYVGIQTGFKKFDEAFGYLKPGALYYVGARTSMGKTTFMLNLIKGILTLDPEIPIGLFSLEMTSKMIVSKLACIFSDIWYCKYEDGNLNSEEQYKLKQTTIQMRKMPIYFEDDPDLTISKVRMRARRMVEQNGVKIIFIDYLTRIKSDLSNQSMHLQVNQISKSLQSLAKELNVPMVCLAQLNRKSLDSRDSRPCLADFRESGSIEEDADGCILIHRPEYYDKNNKPGIIQIMIAKNRIRGQIPTIEFGRSSYSEAFFELEEFKNDILEIKKTKINI